METPSQMIHSPRVSGVVPATTDASLDDPILVTEASTDVDISSYAPSHSSSGADSSGEEESSPDEVDRPSRPNKYHGPPSTWQEWTRSERHLYSSILQQRAADLSIHLYNAHALKARLRNRENTAKVPAWAAKESWMHAAQQKDEDPEGSGFYPPPSWTAWPMPVQIVPREGEKVGYDKVAADERWTLRRKEKERPSRVLEDIATAGILRAAKERFEARDWEDEEDEEKEEEAKGSGSSSRRLRKTASTERESVRAGAEPNQSDRNSHLAERRDYEKPETGKPVVMADDDEARTLLRPTVRHILSKFDDLLMGLHHSRQAYANISNGSTSEVNQAPASQSVQAAPLPKRKRRSGPRRKEVNMDLYVPPSGAGSAEPEGDCGLGAEGGRNKKKMGRPRKYGRPVEGVSYSTMRRRILEAQALAAQEDNDDGLAEEEESSFDDARPDSYHHHRYHHPEATKEDHYRRRPYLGLRDWSDVLGIASLTGWDEAVVSRAKRRCEGLFGERVEFRTLREEEASYPRRPPRRLVEDEGGPRSAETAAPAAAAAAAAAVAPSQETTEEVEPFVPPRRRFFGSSKRIYFCPFSECIRSQHHHPHATTISTTVANPDNNDNNHNQPRLLASTSDGDGNNKGKSFSRKQHLLRHLRLVHGVEKGKEEEAGIVVVDDDNADDMKGGVHVDGFLKLIPSPLSRTSRLRRKMRMGGKGEGEREEEREEEGNGEGEGDEDEDEEGQKLIQGEEDVG